MAKFVTASFPPRNSVSDIEHELLAGRVTSCVSAASTLAPPKRCPTLNLSDFPPQNVGAITKGLNIALPEAIFELCM